MSRLEDNVDRILYSEQQIQDRIKELGAQISADYEGKNPLLVSVLKGSVVFMADLMRSITIPCSIDFMATTSYPGETTVALHEPKLLKDLDGPISGMDVIIVEDIFDSGKTLQKLCEMLLKPRNPASLRICTLLDKPDRRAKGVTIKPDYVGFSNIPNEFIIGYGLDYNQLYRNLPYIGILKDSAK